MKKNGVSKLDFVIATHSHSDHIGGMPEIARNFVDSNTKYYYRKYIKLSEDTSHPDWDNQGYYDRAIAEMKKYNASLIEVTNKYPVIKIGNFEIKLINTEPMSEDETGGENANSLVALLKYGDKKVLFTGDLLVKDELKLIEKYSKELENIDVLKMGHHGSRTSTCIEFAKKLNPKYVIIPNNGVSHTASLASIRYFQRNGASVYSTRLANDAIILTFLDKLSFTIDDGKTDMSLVETGISSTMQGNWEIIKNKNNVMIGKAYYKNGEYSFGPTKVVTDGKEEWYYFQYVCGTLMKNTWVRDKSTGDKYIYVDKDGKISTGWKKLDGVWYYLLPSLNKMGFPGEMAEGWRKISGYWYYLRRAQDTTSNKVPVGGMLVGWQKLNTSKGEYWFYFAQNNNDVEGYREGQMITGRHLIDYNGKEEYYYFAKTDSDVEGYLEGAMISNMTIDNHYYGANGTERQEQQETKVVTEKNKWIKVDSKWFYLDENGEYFVGWKKYKDFWYYLYPNETAKHSKGEMITGWQKIGGYWYYLRSSNDKVSSSIPVGGMVKGWQKLNSSKGEFWFYFAEDSKSINGYKEGQMVVGRQLLSYESNEDYYYFARSDSEISGYVEGAMVRNIEIDNHYYCGSGAEVEETIVEEIVPIIEEKKDEEEEPLTSEIIIEDASKIQEEIEERTPVVEKEKEAELAPSVEGKKEDETTHSTKKDETATYTKVDKTLPSAKEDKKDETVPRAQEDKTHEKEESDTPKEATLDFIDVRIDDWFYDPVAFVVKKGLFNGITETEFCPNKNISRAMLVTVLHRLSNAKENEHSSFSDVDNSMYYSIPIAWAEKNKIVNGVGEGLFAPDKDITRQDLASIITRFVKAQKIELEDKENKDITFQDSELIADYAKEDIKYLVKKGLMQGRENNEFCPLDTATRAEVATLMKRIMKM